MNQTPLPGPGSLAARARLAIASIAAILPMLAMLAGGGGCLDPSTFRDGEFDAMPAGGDAGVAGAASGGGHAGTGPGGTGGFSGGGTAGQAPGGSAGHASGGSAGHASGGSAGQGSSGAAGMAGAASGGTSGAARGGSGGAAAGGSAGAAGSGSAGAAAGGSGGAACSAEQCNGRDDDCDGIIDDGCPIAGEPLGTRTTSATSAVFGSVSYSGNTRFADACPDGQAIIGFTGNAGSGLDSVGVRCGALRVREDRTTQPFKYSVAVSAGLNFAPSGGGGGTQHLVDSYLLCGPDEVVVSVTAKTEPTGGMCPNKGCTTDATNALGCPVIYGMAVSCASYDIVGTPGAFKLAVSGTPVMSSNAGGSGRTSPAAVTSVFSCLPTGMLRQAIGAFGPWVAKCAINVVNGMQFACTNPTLPVR